MKGKKVIYQSNNQSDKNVTSLNFQQNAINQSCRTCLRNPCKKDETQEKALEKVEELIHNAEIDIPRSKNDRVHRNEPKKVRSKQLLRSSQHLDRHPSLLHRARQKIENDVKLFLDLSKKDSNFSWTHKWMLILLVGYITFVFADLKVEFHNTK